MIRGLGLVVILLCCHIVVMIVTVRDPLMHWKRVESEI